ncbi:MBL fold metallo-hydrolase [Natronorarus salvus]|uniref:MBL fold metallo-hydrolase n=1 Tax=Natronorarus salvus TaxID=3117733 RepID=UPI002F260AA7
MERISLGNQEFEGRNNAYVLEGEGLTLVDTGVATGTTREGLREGLADLGYGFADVSQVVLTHFHSDHAGLAGEIQAEGDATVYVHGADAPLVAQEEAALSDLDALRRRLFTRWGMPDEEREGLLAFLEGHTHIAGEPVDVTPIEDGTAIEAGETLLRAVHTPGHAAGHCCYELEGASEAFVGDAILPVYTPNVGGADVRVDRPLERYLKTLSRIAGAKYGRAWPGHRDPIDDPSGRARTIAAHHRERTENVLGVLSEHGPADAWTVSAHLFGDLSGIHVMHGPGEAYAHLDHLAREGVVADADGTYELLESDPDLEAVLAVE